MEDFFKPNEKILCVEQETERGITGFFRYSPDSIETQLTSFDGFFHLPDHGCITLLAEDLQFITLFNSFSSPGTRTKHSEPEQHSYTQRVHSNLALVGHSPWTEEMTVKQVSFEVPHAQRILENSEFIELLAGQERYSDMDRRVVHTSVNGVTISVWYAARYGSTGEFPTEWGPRIEVTFDEPKSVYDFTDALFFVTSFLSFNLGTDLQWQEASISHMDDDEIDAAIAAQSYVGRHQAIFLLGDNDPEMQGSGNWGSPCLCYNDNERAVFGDCLNKWVARAPEWKTAYGLMMNFLRHKGTIGADRLLAACKCLEQIPDTQSLKVLDDSDIDQVISAAVTKANDLGHGKLGGRIRSSLQRVGTEDHDARFRRLYAGALNGHRTVRPFDSVISDLKNAMRLRGHAAHRALHTDTDAEFQTLARAISSVECLCFLLLAKDLPLSAEGKERMFRNPLVSDYITSF
ncbi:hypothetical protein [Phaeobacter porticola]|uniref:ApeA N-terminal domain-containing protein n=1 Tax=Phaeobacter porticola TaxID=1844006 RepID=A0A1L3I616_9RHOB|nr:hypothetical protein [Phaeobacter porticola]APG47604.1 hypothetical protein PhaeoP97_02207 [Phaeobacter porticola]